MPPGSASAPAGPGVSPAGVSPDFVRIDSVGDWGPAPMASGRSLEGVSELKHAPFILVPSDDLQSHR
jgi:hypothetical protein